MFKNITHINRTYNVIHSTAWSHSDHCSHLVRTTAFRNSSQWSANVMDQLHFMRCIPVGLPQKLKIKLCN